MITQTQDRFRFIGGSEANNIYLNYESATFISWWQNKLDGVNDAPFSNLHMEVGTILEPDVLNLYESIHNIKGERDGQQIKGIARANTDYIIGDKVSDVKVSKKAREWHTKGKVPIKYKRQLIHYCYVCELKKASVIAYECDDELLDNPFAELTQDKLYEIEVPVTEKEILNHKHKIEYLEHCRDLGIFPQ